MLGGTAAILAATVSGIPAAAAMGEGARAPIEEVVVTARRREETALSTPVVLTALSGDMLENGAIDNLTEVSELVPQLLIQDNASGFGGSISLRGVSSPTSSVAIDQAVSLVLDGVPVSYGGAVQLGFFDVQQIEVLKGPQALFFGKNATGGIISLESAGPTDQFESRVRASYETEADEVVGEFFVSGPLTETLGGRFAARYKDQEGYIKNILPPGTPGTFGPANEHGPGTEEIAARGTLHYEPNAAFSANFKLGFIRNEDHATYMQAQRIACPYGAPLPPGAIPGVSECEADDRVARSDLDPALATLYDPRFGDGVPFEELDQLLGTLDLNYSITDDISMNSITGYYDLEYDLLDDAAFGFSLLAARSVIEKSTWSEEIRIYSQGPGRFNWMIGGLYQYDELSTGGASVIGQASAPAAVFPWSLFHIDSSTLSGFAQAIFDVSDTIELSGGVRYSYEQREQEVTSDTPFVETALDGNLPNEITFSDWSPELTLTWRPSSTLTIFGSYKTGYKSGGFQASQLDTVPALFGPFDNSFEEETVAGGEIGVKSAVLDGSLMVDAAVYRYNYDDLQLSSFEAQTASTKISNVAGSTVQGIETSFNYQPRMVDGLGMFGSVAYNEAEYDEFSGDCYTGQTIAEGCSAADTDGDGRFDKQDLSGETLPRAPEWSGRLGFTYDVTVTNGMVLTVGSSANYTSKYSYMQQLQPESFQDDVTKLDASLAFGPIDGRWKIALIGRNLTEEFRGTSGAGVPLTGNPSLTGTTTPGGKSDVFGTVNRGREYWVRFTARPNLFR